MKVISTETQVTSYTIKAGDKKYYASYHEFDGELDVCDYDTNEDIDDGEIMEKVAEAIDIYETDRRRK